MACDNTFNLHMYTVDVYTPTKPHAVLVPAITMHAHVHTHSHTHTHTHTHSHTHPTQPTAILHPQSPTLKPWAPPTPWALPVSCERGRDRVASRQPSRLGTRSVSSLESLLSSASKESSTSTGTGECPLVHLSHSSIHDPPVFSCALPLILLHNPSPSS